MISSKHLTKLSIILVSVALVMCVILMVFPNIIPSSGYTMEYKEKLFNTDNIIEIDIQMENFRDMLDNAMQEEYYPCNVTINGTSFYRVGIRPKGNTSLSSVARDPENDRYSFKLEFDQFVDGQTCFGLDKLALNNNYADATSMKEAIVYDMYKYMGTDAPLYNYAKISVNGEYFGIYLALEGIEESFMLRTYGNQKGYIYKPDNMNMGKGMGFGRGGGANLNYINSSYESYSAIWNGEVTDSSKADHLRIITALKNISEKKHTEKYMDTENLLKFMTVHNFAVNDDSLSGNMAHNYYLYECNSKLNIIPWDYNLSFGGMNSKNASDVINKSIDALYSSTKFFDIFLEDENYKEQYHQYYSKLINEYIFSGKFEETYNRIRTQIDELTKDDPNAMFTYEEYTAAADMFFDTIMLRAQSVKNQLNGNGETVDTSSIDLSVLGQFRFGGISQPKGENRQ